MRRVFVRNLALVLVLNLLVKPFYILGIDAEVQVRVGTTAYGTYNALLSLSFLLNILLDLGITNWNTRHIARDPASMRDQVSGLIALRLLLAVLYVVVMGLSAWVLGYGPEHLAMLAVLAFNQFLVATILYLRSNVAGAQRFAQDSLLSVLDRVLLIAICSWMLWVHFAGRAFPLKWFVLAQTVSYAITCAVAFLLVAKAGGGVPFPHWKPQRVREVLKESFPFALLVLLMSFYYRTDTVMLERMLPDGAYHAGVYAQGFRFFESLNMLGYLFAGLLLPMFSRMLKEGADTGPLAGLAWRLVLLGTIAVAAFCSAHAEEVLRLRYGASTEPTAPAAFAVMIWSFVAVCTTYVFGTLLTASGDLITLNRMAAVGMALNIGLNWLLIPRSAALGAAWAGVITQGATAIVQVVLASRRFRFKPRPSHVMGLAIYSAVLIVISFGSASMDVPLFPAFAAICVAALLLLLGLRILPLGALKTLIVRQREA